MTAAHALLLCTAAPPVSQAAAGDSCAPEAGGSSVSKEPCCCAALCTVTPTTGYTRPGHQQVWHSADRGATACTIRKHAQQQPPAPCAPSTVLPRRTLTPGAAVGACGSTDQQRAHDFVFNTHASAAAHCLPVHRYIDYMRLVLGSKARELYQSLDAVLEPPKPGKAAPQQVRAHKHPNRHSCPSGLLMHSSSQVI